MTRRPRASAAWVARGGCTVLVLAFLGLGSAPALAYGLQPRLTLPETLRGTVQVPLPNGDGLGDTAADTLRELYPRLAACWQVPPGLARFERTEITARFALRRDGSVIGEPRITFATQAPDSRARAILARAAVDAIRRCTPARITPALGGAIAGRPIALRFVSQSSRGQGV
jgi:hypothetical protein